MSKLTKKLLYLAMYGLLLPAVAQEVHIVEKGEIVSRIIQKYHHLPIEKLYNGKLKEVIELNPHIQDINLIEPGQTIYLKPQEEIPQKVARAPQSVQESDSTFDLSFDWGIEFLKTTQKTDIGTFKTQVLMPSLLGFTFNTDLDGYGLRAKYRTANFKFQDEKESESSWIHRFEVGGNYKLFAARFEFNQEPFFDVSPLGRIDLAEQTTIWFMAGITDKKQIKLKKETFYRYSFLVGIPLWSDFKNSTQTLNSQSGFKLDLEGDINREIVAFKSSKLLLSLGLGFYYQYQSLKTDLEPIVGKTKINLFKTDLFISLKYGF